MEVNIESTLENMETENIQLKETLRDMDTENIHLKDQVSQLKKCLDKEKKFHRKFADEVELTESTRINDFKNEKRLLVEENQSLLKENRQLAKDVTFYKNAHEELSKETEITKFPSIPSEMPSTSRSREVPEKSTQRSTKLSTKSNTKLFEENKTLRQKIADMKAALAVLKKQNKQYEGFVNKINKKASKFNKETDQLEMLVASTQKTNKDMFNPEVLSRLDRMGNT